MGKDPSVKSNVSVENDDSGFVFLSIEDGKVEKNAAMLGLPEAVIGGAPFGGDDHP